MADAYTLTLVRAPAYQALTRRLAAAVERDPRLVAASDAIMRPVQLLQLMAADTPGALADDVLRADRLRSLLFLALPYASVATEARALLTPPADTHAELVIPEPQPYEPGVIDHAALLVVMLGAARVADDRFAPVFISIVHGLALAASATEVLGRLDPRQPDAAALEIVLETLYTVETTRSVTRNQWLRPFAFDPVERGRWRCLDHLLASGALVKQAASMGAAWDGATSHEIQRVAPRAIAAGDVITVTIDRPAEGADPLGNAEVIFASPDGPPLVAEASVRPSTSGQPTLELEVLVPDGAGAGWVGFSRPDRIDASNQARLELRKALETALAEPCVEGERRIDPQRAIPLYGEIAVPRRRGPNRVESNVPRVTFAAIAPSTVKPRAAIELTWETTGADAVTIASGGRTLLEGGEPSGRLALVAGDDDGSIDYVITPLRDDGAGTPSVVTLVVASPIAITAVEVSQAGRTSRLVAGRPLDVVARLDAPRAQLDGELFLDDPAATPIASGKRRPGAVAFTIPADAVRDQMSFTIVVTDPAGARVSVRHGPIGLGRLTHVPVVLVRPVVLDRDESRISLASATRLLDRAASELGVELSIVDLPWADDELAVLVEQPVSDRDPSLPRILDALSHRALITPGFEDALWLVMLPDDEEETDVARWEPGYAARALAIAAPPAIARLLADVFANPVPASQPARYLAIHGTLAADGVDVTETRVDRRRAGPGARTKSALEAITLDAAGRELARHEVRVLSKARPAQLDFLIPISDEVASVELRGASQQLAVLGRTRGELTIEVKSASDAPPYSLHWNWKHDRNARPSVSLLLRRGALATPVVAIDPCYDETELPLWRYATGDGLSLYATDGWNASERVVHDGTIERELTAVVRRLSDGRFFADVPRDAAVSWRLDGVPRGDGTRTLSLQPGDEGLLTLKATRGEVTASDHRAIRAGEVT
jgi:hypothetical protein